jgi:hypothetical protein
MMTNGLGSYILVYIRIYSYEAPWSPVSYHIPDDEDRDGPRNVGFFQTSDAADTPRRFC